ncbi:MAG: VCBS repeat-containing protein, partial [Pedobacter sp.]|nr:VCBS repeat-containing protein [Pedobacter sp.]
MKYFFPILIILFFLSSCSKKKEIPLFELEENTGIQFNNKIIDGPLENSFLFRNFYNGGGVAIGDINNDGLADVIRTSNMGQNKLYLNKGRMNFQDISTTTAIK